MKHTIRSLCLAVCLMLLLCLPALAVDNTAAESIVDSGTCGTDLTWHLDIDGNLFILGTGEMDSYTIGTTPWYDYRNTVTAVYTSEGVTSLSPYVFEGFSALTYAEIADTVTLIGEGAFENCAALAEVDFGSGVETIDTWAFYQCSSLTEIYLPDSLVAINGGAFYRCTSLTEVHLGRGVRSLNSYYGYKQGNSGDAYYRGVFEQCGSLHTFTVSDRLDTIGPDCFTETAIEIVNIPDTVKTLLNTVYELPYVAAFNAPYGDGQGFESRDDILYQHTDDGLVLLKCPLAKTFDAPFTVPSDVVSIADYAFMDIDTLPGVTFCPALQSIGRSAFNRCYALEEIDFADGLEYIGIFAFANCDSLTELVLPDTVKTLDGGAFYSCDNLETVDLGRGVREALSYYGYAQYTSGDTYYKGAFEDCVRLHTVTMSNRLETVGPDIFCEVPLTTMVIPDSTTYVHPDLYGLATLTEFVAPCADGKGYESRDGILYQYTDDGYTLLKCPQSKVFTAPYKLYLKTVAVADYAFMDNTSLTSVTFNRSLRSIGRSAFNRCYALEEVTFVEGLTYIGIRAFQHCDSLTALTLPDSLETIDGAAFYNCDNLETVDLGRGLHTVYSLGEYSQQDDGDRYQQGAFEQCYKLHTVTLPDDLHTVGYDMFSADPLITMIVPDSVTYVHPDLYSHTHLTAFDAPCADDAGYLSIDGILYQHTEGGMVLLKCPQSKVFEAAYTIPDGPVAIADRAFIYNQTLSGITIPGSVRSIGRSAFNSCPELVTVHFNEGLEEIGIFAFAYSEKIKQVILPDSIETIRGAAFYRCRGLRELDLGRGLTTVEQLGEYSSNDTGDRYERGAFEGCSNLKTVTAPDHFSAYPSDTFVDTIVETVIVRDTVTDIGFNLYSLSTITAFVGPEATEPDGYFVYDGVLYHTDEEGKQTLVKCPQARELLDGTHKIHKDTDALASSAFWSNLSLTHIDIPASVTNIGSSAFRYCTELQEVTLHGYTWRIGAYAFEGCTALEEIDLGGSLELLETMAFRDCDKLKKVVLPDGLIGIGSAAFYDCDRLEEVWIGRDVRQLNSLNEYEYNDTGDHYYKGAFEQCGKLKAVYFLGDAPTLGIDAFTATALDLTVYYLEEKSGWTSPYWNGIPSETFIPPVVPVEIERIELLDPNGAPTETFAVGNMGVTLHIRNWQNEGIVLLAAYTADGQFIQMRWVNVNEVSGSGVSTSTVLSNDGSIGQLRAVVLSDTTSYLPLGKMTVK